MTVIELIERLRAMPASAEVFLWGGDYEVRLDAVDLRENEMVVETWLGPWMPKYATVPVAVVLS